jgi:lipopolysaccharide export system permease protein
MKKILFRKLLLDYMTFFLVALISASTIIWVFQAVNFLDIMIEDGRDYLVYINYTLLNFPKIFSKLLPFATFFTLFYITLKYENSNELIIFWNFGLNKIQFVNFILKISLILMIIQIIFTSFIVPVSQDKARSFLRNSTVNFFGNFIKPQRFNDTIKGVTIYTEKKDAEGNLYNLYLKKEINNSDKDFQITYAKKGIFKEKNNLPILVLYNGQTITNQNGEVTRFGFSKSDFLLKNFKTNTTLYKKTQELSTTNLFICILLIISSKKEILKKTNYNIENCSIENFVNILKEIYKRIFIPLYIPILMLVPLLLITSSKESENYTRLKFITFGIGLIFIIFSETTIRLISDKQIFNYWIISIPLLFILFLYFTFYKKFNFN